MKSALFVITFAAAICGSSAYAQKPVYSCDELVALADKGNAKINPRAKADVGWVVYNQQSQLFDTAGKTKADSIGGEAPIVHTASVGDQIQTSFSVRDVKKDGKTVYFGQAEFRSVWVGTRPFGEDGTHLSRCTKEVISTDAANSSLVLKLDITAAETVQKWVLFVYTDDGSILLESVFDLKPESPTAPEISPELRAKAEKSLYGWYLAYLTLDKCIDLRIVRADRTTIRSKMRSMENTFKAAKIDTAPHWERAASDAEGLNAQLEQMVSVSPEAGQIHCIPVLAPFDLDQSAIVRKPVRKKDF